MRHCYSLICFLFISPYLHAQSMVVSSYYIGEDAKSCWIELLVTEDNTDIRNWTIGDYNANNGGHLNGYQSIAFKPINLWNHLRKGTIIVLYCRSANAPATDTSAADGFISVHAQLTSVFSSTPTNNSSKLSLNYNTDMITIKNGTTDIHSLGHGGNHGNWNVVNNPKVINEPDGYDNRLIQVCPGANIAGYNNTSEDTIKTNMISSGFTQGLPNIRTTSATDNQNFWLTLREPAWSSPTLTVSSNTNYTTDTLKWNSTTDPYPTDTLQGYLIVSCTTNTFTALPVDGKTYTNGQSIGNSTIIGIINNSQTLSFTYTHTYECKAVYYRVYAFRFKTDEPNGNNYHVARGRAYNQTNYAQGQSTIPSSTTILYHY